MVSGPSIPEAHLSCIWSSHGKSQSLLYGARLVVVETCTPRALLSHTLYIQSPFLLKSSEIHKTSQELGKEGVAYGCSETINETFCFYIFTSAFPWFRRSQVLASTKERSRSFMRPLMICKLVHGLVTLSFTGTFFNIIWKLKELEKWMQSFYWSSFHTWIKKIREFCLRKEYLWTPISNVQLQKGHLL